MAKEKSKIKLVIKKEINEEFISDILVTAFEGGSNYWIKKIKVKDGDFKGQDFASHVVAAGGVLTIEEIDNTETHELTRDMMIKGIVKYIQKKNSLEVLEDYDSIDADDILQYAIFGKTVYG